MTKIKALAPEMRAYLRRLLIAMIIYMAILIPVTYVVRRDMVSGWIVYLLAVLPALPIVGVFWVIMRLLVEMKDEYQRMLLVRQTLIATAITLSVATVWGFLESYAGVTHLPSMHVAVFWFFALIPARLFVHLDWK